MVIHPFHEQMNPFIIIQALFNIFDGTSDLKKKKKKESGKRWNLDQLQSICGCIMYFRYLVELQRGIDIFS